MKQVNLAQPQYYLNRELSFLAFNRRVLALAQDCELPLLERLRYLFICSNNLDEFFEIRVAGIKTQHAIGSVDVGPDGLSPSEVLKRVCDEAHQICGELYDCLNKELMPALKKESIKFLDADEWDEALTKWVEHYFKTEILPVLSPIGLDFSHPFPRLINKSLNFILDLTGEDAFGRNIRLAILHAPRSLQRVLRVPDALAKSGDNFIYLSEIIGAHAADLFPGMNVAGIYQFRITRKSDLFINEDEVDDLARALKGELLSRRFSDAVRLEIDSNCPHEIASFLLKKHGLTEQDLYYCAGPVNLNRFTVLFDEIGRLDLCYPAFIPKSASSLKSNDNIFDVIRKKDILLHHPFESFNPVVEFVRQAAHDPDVLAIKQTLYRIRADSLMVEALIDAARAGKEVTAIIELRARFDEESNIELANRLQEAGAMVVYGVVGYKTHAKLILVVRRENQRLKRYAHLGTGNYHEKTAQLYTDYGLMTYDKGLTADVQKVFQQLTGLGKAIKLKKLYYSPFTLYKALTELIDEEMAAAKAGKPAVIFIKVNGLTDAKIIKKLYEASQVGVKIDLVVRGVCRLKPGIKGVSENIKVRSILGRFLEHSRVYYFFNGGDEKIFCASADWMERNLYHRVEVCFPIEDEKLKKRIKQEIVINYLADNCQSWHLQSDGVYKLSKPKSGKRKSAQEMLLEKLAFQRFSE